MGFHGEMMKVITKVEILSAETESIKGFNSV